MCPADITDTTTYARVAQLVEHDLAKVGAAGSSPVSRSLLTKRTSGGCPFFVKSSPAGPGRSRSTLRSGRRRADVHWTSCAVSRSPSRSRHLSFFAPLRSLPNSVHRTLASSLRFGRRRTDVHWTSCFFAPLRSAQSRRPLDVLRRLALSFQIKAFEFLRSAPVVA